MVREKKNDDEDERKQNGKEFIYSWREEEECRRSFVSHFQGVEFLSLLSHTQRGAKGVLSLLYAIQQKHLILNLPLYSLYIQKVKDDMGSSDPFYVYTGKKKEREFPPWELFHMNSQNLGWESCVGESHETRRAPWWSHTYNNEEASWRSRGCAISIFFRRISKRIEKTAAVVKMSKTK